MSLLLEALKKAEKAKEEAQKRRQGGAQAKVELQLEPTGELQPQVKPVLTRSELPDIRQPLEIATDDVIAPTRKREPSAVPGATAAPRAASPSATAGTPRDPGLQQPAAAEQRAAAKKVFEAKFKEPNPRLPFYIVLGVLGAFAVGIVIYFWYQLRPPPALVNTNPPKPAGEQVAVAPAAKPAPQQAAIVAPAAPQIPGLPAEPPKPSADAAAVPAPAKPAAQLGAPAAAPVARRAPAPAPTPQVAEPAPAQAPLTFARAQPQIHPRVQSGYTSYLAGDLSRAREDYEQALREDPSNRDALLGLAAVEARSGRYAAAEGHYTRLLNIDPRDAHAQAGLIGLRGGRIDPVLAESRVKSLLAYSPDAPVLRFTLGNQLAQQGRWPEAQQEYFKAFAADPENADFAYNLAVSLDQLRQPKLALEYYQRALALAKANASFDARAARERVNQLSR